MENISEILSAAAYMGTSLKISMQSQQQIEIAPEIFHPC